MSNFEFVILGAESLRTHFFAIRNSKFEIRNSLRGGVIGNTRGFEPRDWEFDPLPRSQEAISDFEIRNSNFETEKWGCSSIGRALGLHPRDAGSIPVDSTRFRDVAQRNKKGISNFELRIWDPCSGTSPHTFSNSKFAIRNSKFLPV